MLYIMRRTQLYLNDDIWKALHLESRRRNTTISELVRRAVREKYGASPADRRKAMAGLVGLRKNRTGPADSTAYIRKLRKGARLARLSR